MELWIVRHGEAEAFAPDEMGPALSHSGKSAVEKANHWLVRQGRMAQILLASPLRRAQETAVILNESWELEVQTVDWLKPGVEPGKVLDELARLECELMVLVGHLPTLGWLLSTMVWGFPPKEIVLPTGSVTSLKVRDWEPAGANLSWMLNPETDL